MLYKVPAPTNFRQHFDANTVGRDFIVADVHGCYMALDRLLKHVAFDPWKDRLFSCGDLIDRGPHSLDCLHLVDYKWFYSVRGNHEHMMIDCIMYDAHPNMWVMNGGEWAYPAGAGKKDREEFARFVRDIEPFLPYIITVGEGEDRFNIVHAEFKFTPDVSDEDVDNVEFDSYDSEWMIWGRDIINGHPAPHSENLSTTYVGHTPLENIAFIGKQVYIDGGYVFGDKLHLVEHKTKKVYTLNAKTDKISESNLKG